MHLHYGKVRAILMDLSLYSKNTIGLGAFPLILLICLFEVQFTLSAKESDLVSYKYEFFSGNSFKISLVNLVRTVANIINILRPYLCHKRRISL
jgi:hypothetical protein